MTANPEGVRLAGKLRGWCHWTTPKVVLDCVRRVNAIALDPCSNDASTVGAGTKFWEHGHEVNWKSFTHETGGLVYVNPPYNAARVFVEKCVGEGFIGCEIILLVAARPDTQWTKLCFKSAEACCFWEGRIKFENPPPESQGDAPSIPSVLYYWGRYKNRFRLAFAPRGFCVDLVDARRFSSMPMVVP